MPMEIQAVATIGALLMALLAWLKSRDVERLRSELTEREERLRAELLRETLAQESRLRVKEETRLHMFTEATRGAAQVERELEIAGDEIVTAVYELRRDAGEAAFDRVHTLSQSYAQAFSGAGIFLPPALDLPARSARTAVLKAAHDIRRLCRRDEPVDQDDSDEVLVPLRESLDAFREAAHAWKRRYWEAWDAD